VRIHELPATPATVHWGHFDARLEPVLTVESGDLVRLEALTHHAGDAPDLLMDEGIERVFAEVQDRGPGPHLLTGPIAVAGARPGDVLEVAILSDPHVSQGDGEVSGTALEASLDTLLRLTVRQDLDVRVPVLETTSELLVHGFGDDLDEAMRAATRRTLDLLGTRYGLSRDDAYAFTSVAVDFTVTQVVDGRQGVHARIDKGCFPFWQR
jgi:acetamidase/formamidase